MAKKTFRIKLYYPHDLDLISLMLTHEVNLTKAIYCALNAFCKGEVFAIKIPPRRDVELPKRRQYNKDLNLYTDHDLDAIELLTKIAPGYRNNFLKNLLRLYILHPATESFLRYPEEMPLFDDYFSVFRTGKQEVDAAAMKKKNKKEKKKENKRLKKIEKFKTEEECDLFSVEKESEMESYSPNEDANNFLMEETSSYENDPEMDDLTNLFSSLIQ